MLAVELGEYWETTAHNGAGDFGVAVKDGCG